MITQIIAVLCEGPHDVAFLVKILKTEGFKTIDFTKFSDLPSPMSNLLKEEVRRTNLEELHLTQLRKALLPTNILKKDNIYLFFYALGGESREDLRNSILEKFKLLIPEKGEFNRLPKDTKLKVAYVFDADNKGVEARVKELNQELSKVFPNCIFQNNSDIVVDAITLGCYIFSKAGTNTGKLENLILPLMKSGNEAIFYDAESFLNTHTNIKWKKGYDQEKAIIGVAGQLQKSGSTNTVIIAQTDFINEIKIQEDSKCQEIIDFFNLLTRP